ncbi:hypothetical protein [Actinoallomurus oryzae]|uniref:hypothetical protein n=1 Tax=Actinoallomurus oryzae TaxID=502180 RepID=UPI003CD079EF
MYRPAAPASAAAWHSSAASTSFASQASAARCQTRRARCRSSSRTLASSSCTVFRSASGASAYTALRMTGLGTVIESPSTRTSPHARTASSSRRSRRSASAALVRVRPSRRSSATASRASRRASGDRRKNLRRYTARSRLPGGSVSGGGCSPESWPGVSAAAISTSASGLPPVSSVSPAARSSVTPVGHRSVRTSVLAASSSGGSGSRGIPASRSRSGVVTCSLCAANSITTGSSPSRRAANAMASSDARSSQCTSSIQHRTGPERAVAVSRACTAVQSVNGSAAPFPSNTRRSAPAWHSGRHEIRSATGPSRRCRPASASDDSCRIPRMPSVRKSGPARRTAHSSSAVFPHTGLGENGERTAPPGPGPVEQALQHGELVVTTT